MWVDGDRVEDVTMQLLGTPPLSRKEMPDINTGSIVFLFILLLITSLKTVPAAKSIAKSLGRLILLVAWAK